jgi:hypothetical protein
MLGVAVDDQRLKDFLAREFAGEHWIGRPRVFGLVLASFGIWFFAIPWTAFALFWESMVLVPLLGEWFGYEVKGEAGTGMRIGMWVMALFGLPFILIGFGMLLAPYFAWRKGRRQLYVVSNRRLAFLETGTAMKVRSIPIDKVGEITRSEKKDGSGKLSIFMGYDKDSDGDRVAKNETIADIPDVRALEKLIVDLRERARRG